MWLLSPTAFMMLQLSACIVIPIEWKNAKKIEHIWSFFSKNNKYCIEMKYVGNNLALMIRTSWGMNNRKKEMLTFLRLYVVVRKICKLTNIN